MAEISGQSREQTLHILILPVPCRHSMNRERVPQVVKAWLVGRFIVTRDARDPSQAGEAFIDHLEPNGIAALRLEQWSIVLILSCRHFEILLKQLPDILPQRHQARFIKFRASYRDQAEPQVYIHEPESQCFPESHSRSVEEQQQRAERGSRHDAG